MQLAPPPQGDQDDLLMVQALVMRQVLVRGKVHRSAERGVVLMGNHRLSFDDHLVACSKCGADGCEHDDDGP